jgi:FMN phosphatase YigB (HAD superfamily)
VLSLDLWFTTLYYRSPDEERWRAARTRILRELVKPRTGGTYSAAEISEAIHAVRHGGERAGHPPDQVGPLQVVQSIARRLGGELTAPPEAAAARYSAAGLDEDPPQLNPEVVTLAAALPDVPLIAITNTGRLGSTWETAIVSWGGPRFQHIITSCEVGRGKPDRAIFDEAVRRLGVPAAEILHVGDRWDLDIEGALGAGFGAALYGGLWDLYPAGTYADPNGHFGGHDPKRLGPEVLYLEHLAELLEGDRFARSTGPHA